MNKDGLTDIVAVDPHGRIVVWQNTGDPPDSGTAFKASKEWWPGDGPATSYSNYHFPDSFSFAAPVPAPPQSQPQPPPPNTGCYVNEPVYDDDGNFEGYDTQWVEPSPYIAQEAFGAELGKGTKTQRSTLRGPRIVVFPSDSIGPSEGLPEAIERQLRKPPVR
jgi:hypothetical protein